MAKIACLLVLLVVIQACYGLKCYNCGGNFLPCKDKSSDGTAECAPLSNSPNYDQFCAKIEKSGVVEKRCYNDVKGAAETCTDKNGQKICLCKGDKCNSSTTISLSSFAMIGLVAAFLAPKVFVH